MQRTPNHRLGRLALILQLLGIAVLLALAWSALPAGATMVSAHWTWEGTRPGDWWASGNLRYDDAIMQPTARGPLLGGYSTGIEFVDLSLFDSTGALRGTWTEILNYVPLYTTLQLTLDPSALTKVGIFELGETDDTLRRSTLYLNASVGIITWNRVIVARGGGAIHLIPDVIAAPIAAPWWLLLIGLALLTGQRLLNSRVKQ